MREVIREDLNKGEVSSLENVNVRQLVISLIIVTFIIILVLGLFYYLFFQQSIDRLMAGQYRAWSGSVASPTDWNIHSDNEIDADTVDALKEEILGNNLLNELRDFEEEIPLEPVGKRNPFVPWAGPADEQFVLPVEEEKLDEIVIPLIEDTKVEDLEGVLNGSKQGDEENDTNGDGGVEENNIPVL